MIPIPPEDFNAAYFGDSSSPWRHRGGYDDYDASGRAVAAQFADRIAALGHSILELGCAKGFLVEALLKRGADARGIDCSIYAIDCAPEAIRPLLMKWDMRRSVSLTDKYEVVCSLRFLPCFPEPDLPRLVLEMNRISRRQFHLIDESPNPEFYLVKPLEWWLELPWKPGTILRSNNRDKELVK